MNRLVPAELFKLRTTNTWWLFAPATLHGTAVMLVVKGVAAHSLLQPLAQYLSVESHGHAANLPPQFLARLTDEWTLGHSAVTQAVTLYTAGQLPGVLLACFLGVVLVTSEYHHQTATTTFLVTPRRTGVVTAKLVTAVLLAGLAWLASTILSVVAGAVFLHTQGYGSQLGHGEVVRAVLLNLDAYLLWSVFGVGAVVLVAYRLAIGGMGVATLRRRDIA